MAPLAAPVRNALTVDVEDYFQVSAFEGVVPRETWDRHEVRVEANTHALLDLFRARGVKGTFFTLGWVAERRPDLLRAIRAQGHEIASHGFEHRLVHGMTPEAFRADLRRASDAIEAACGVVPTAFRAPSFSFSEATYWAYDVLREEGYTASSSVFPVRHDRYGIPTFPRHPVKVADRDGRWLWEFPMTTWRVLGVNVPASGGGWMRLLPPAVLRRAMRKVNAAGVPAVLYLHPWEVDPDQPRIAASRLSRFRHYLNLSKMRGRLERLLDAFPFGTLSEALAQVGETQTLTLTAAARTTANAR